MRKLKSLVIIGLLLISISTVFAAGGAENEAETEAVPAGEFDVNLTDDPMTIYVWAISGAQVSQWKVIEKLYEADNPNINIEVTSIDPPGAMREAAGPAVASGQEDLDILWYWGGGRPFEWLDAGLVHDLKPYYDYYDWNSQMLDGYQPYAFTPDGEMPWFCTDWVSMPFLYYNKTIFSEVGIDPESLVTMEDFFGAGEKLKAAGYDPISVTGTSPNYPSWTQSALAARFLGQEEYAKLRDWPIDTERTAESAEIFKSEGMAASIDLIKQFAEKLFPENFEAYDDTAANEAFINGKAAMRLGGSWWIPTFSGIDAGRLHIPAVTEDGYAPAISFFANGISVPAYVDDSKLDRISDILNSILSKEYAVAIFESGSAWSTSANVSQEDIESVMDPMYFESLELMQKYGTDTIQHFLMSSDGMQTYLQIAGECLLGGLSTEDALDDIYKAMLRDLP